MPPSAPRADVVAERLAAVGLVPRVRDRGDHVRVEAEVHDQVSPDSWEALLRALQLADRFGHDISTDGVTVWAVVAKRSPRGSAGCPGEWPSA